MDASRPAAATFPKERGTSAVRDADGRGSGVDLLAKFYAGSDAIGGVGTRIKNFAARYMFAGAKDPARSAEILYQGIRNPLLHSFTLYDRKLEVWLVNRQPGFDIIEKPQKPGHVLISVEGVYLAFLRGLKA